MPGIRDRDPHAGQVAEAVRFRQVLGEQAGQVRVALDRVDPVRAVGQRLQDKPPARGIQDNEKSFPETAENEPEILAYHYTEAGLVEPAIAWWRHAGARSVSRSAFAEAVAQFQNARTLIEKLPDSPERDAMELDLLIEQAGPIIASTGLYSPEVDQAQVRALELCEKLGETQKMLPILHARYNYNQGIGRPAVALQFAEEYLRLAETMGDDTALMIGHRATGAALWHVGTLAPALEHVEQGLELYQPELHRALVTQYGFDIKTTALMNQIVLLGSLGYPERAAAILQWRQSISPTERQLSAISRH